MSKILIVDDSATIRAQVGQALESGGFDVIEANDGIEGLAALETHREIALVMLDVNMPRMGGLEMLEKLKDGPSPSSVPVVMLTTEGQQTLIERAKKAGAKGWVVKPFKPDLLLKAVKRLTSTTPTNALAHRREVAVSAPGETP